MELAILSPEDLFLPPEAFSTNRAGSKLHVLWEAERCLGFALSVSLGAWLCVGYLPTLVQSRLHRSICFILKYMLFSAPCWLPLSQALLLSVSSPYLLRGEGGGAIKDANYLWRTELHFHLVARKCEWVKKPLWVKKKKKKNLSAICFSIQVQFLFPAKNLSPNPLHTHRHTCICIYIGTDNLGLKRHQFKWADLKALNLLASR